MGELRKAKRNEALCLHRRKGLAQSMIAKQWREISNSAGAADKAGDARSTYRLILKLGAFRTTTLPGFKLADRSFALDTQQESE